MTSNEELRIARDEAFAAYLKVRKAGGTSPAKRARLINLTLLLHRRERIGNWQEMVAREAS